MKKYNVVSIGGGTGQAIVLKALKGYSNLKLSAIVTVTDSGRNSGLIRKDLKIIPPGDIRNCLLALSSSDSILKTLCQYRFVKGKSLKGLSLGNLILAALADLFDGFDNGLKELCRALKVKGEVIPLSLENINICAELMDGSIVSGEVKVRELKKGEIKKVFLDKKKLKPNLKAIQALKKADFIFLGPGSLYTSVIANLLIDAIREAIARSKAKKVYIANLLTQPGQTDGFSGRRHMEEMVKYLGKGVLDYIIINRQKLGKSISQAYLKKGVQELKFNSEELKKEGIIPIYGSFIEGKNTIKDYWDKENLLQHDEKKLGSLLYELIKTKGK